MNLQTLYLDIRLQELLQPTTYTLNAGQDVSTCSATLKVRQTLASASVIVTLSSPTDITLSADGTILVTFTAAHFAALLAGLSGDGVYDLLITPVSGAPALASSGPISVTRTVSR